MGCLMSTYDGHSRSNMEIKAIFSVKLGNSFVMET